MESEQWNWESETASWENANVDAKTAKKYLKVRVMWLSEMERGSIFNYPK